MTINIERLRMLTEEARARQAILDAQQDENAIKLARKIMEKKVPKLLEKAANKGEDHALIYELEEGKDFIGHAKNVSEEHLRGLGKELFALCLQAGLKPRLVSYAWDVLLVAHWDK